MTRIAFIGAGSVEFTRDLLGDLLGFPELADIEIALHDIDPERLDDGRGDGALDRRRSSTRTPTIDDAPRPPRGARRRRLRDQHDPGRRARRDADRLRDPRPLRPAPDDRRHARHRRHLPRAAHHPGDARRSAATWPSCARTRGCSTTRTRWRCSARRTRTGRRTRRSSGSATPSSTRRAGWPSYVGVPFEEVTFLGAGINHQAFILRFERDGEDLYPRLDAAIANDPELQRRVRVELYRRFGYFPTESSEHSAEYLPWLMHDDAAIERFRIPVGEYVRRSEENLVRVRGARARGSRAGERLRDRAQPRVRVADHPLDDHRRAAGDLRQRAQRRPDRQPAATARASRCRAWSTATGVQPTHVGALPPQLRRAQPHVPRTSSS